MAEEKNVSSDRKISFEDLEKMLKAFDWEVHCRRVDEAIVPQIEAYRIARAKSYAQARYHVFV